MQQQTKKAHTGGGLFYFIALIYVGLLILFAWQTSIFVNWLFPDDQIVMKILMVFCFDGMAFLCAVTDLFYHFASRGTRGMIRWQWGISFFLSLLASVLYLVISSFFRFQLEISPAWVDVGYGVTIVAIVFQVVMVTFFLYIEWLVRHPYQDYYLEETAAHVVISQPQPVALAQTTTVKKKSLPRKRVVTEQLAEQGANITQSV